MSLPGRSGGGVWELQRDHVLKVMTFSLRVGEAMLESSVATSDVEDAVRRLTAAFGLGRCEVSVTLNVVTLSYLHPSLDTPVTLVRVVDLGEPRLDRLVGLDRLSRQVQDGDLDVDAAVRRVDEILATPEPPRAWRFLAALASVGAWVVFAGGGLPGAAAGVVGAVAIELLAGPLRRSRVPAVFAMMLAAAIVVAAPSAAAWAGVPIVLAPAIIGGLYPLLPGGALVASVTDGLSGAPLSSMAKGLQAVVSATATAVGAIAALSLSDRLGISSDAIGVVPSRWLELGAAGVAVAGLGLARSMPMRHVLPAAAVAMAAWGTSELWVDPNPGISFSNFAAAVVIGLLSQVFARVQHTTPIVFTASAVFVLVPGFTFYSSMVAFAQADTDMGVELLIRALGISAAIAAGIALGVALARSVPAPRPPIAVWRRGLRR